MNSVFTCQHPIRIHSKYLTEDMYVPCGKCFCCRARKSNTWASRLELERACHPYCLFGTLTYSDKFLPKWNLFNDGFVNSETGEFLPDFDFCKLDNESIQFIKARGCVPVGKVEDCQAFIKRLRDRVKNNPSSERSTCRYIRYFLVCEFGETCLRPHYHFLIFTASKWFAENAKSVVSSCWSTDNRYSNSEQLGLVDVQNVQFTASSYVASYINSYINLPRIYHEKPFKPFKIFSKSPPLGSLLSSSPQIQALFSSSSPSMSIFGRSCNEVIDVPVPKDLCNRLYPKFAGFDRFPSYVFSGLYNLGINFAQMSFRDFKEFVRYRCKNFDDGIARYFKFLIFENNIETDSCLKRLFSILRRIDLQCDIFNISGYSYFKKVQEFYSRYELYLMNGFYRYYEEYSKEHDVRGMLLYDRIYLDFLRKTLSDFRDDSYNLEYFTNVFVTDLKSLGYDVTYDSLSSFLDVSETDDFNFVSYSSNCSKQVNLAKKNHQKNVYLEHRNMNLDFKNFCMSWISRK